jgi:hypothetical protein
MSMNSTAPVVAKGRAYPRASPDARLNRAPVRIRPCGGTPILCSLTPPTGSVVSGAPACTSASDVSFMHAPGARIVADPSSIRSWQERRAHRVTRRQDPQSVFGNPGAPIGKTCGRSRLPLRWQLLFPLLVPFLRLFLADLRVSGLRACVQVSGLGVCSQPVRGEALQEQCLRYPSQLTAASFNYEYITIGPGRHSI